MLKHFLIQFKILSYDKDTNLYMCHDYPNSRELQFKTGRRTTCSGGIGDCACSPFFLGFAASIALVESHIALFRTMRGDTINRAIVGDSKRTTANDYGLFFH